MHIAILTFEGFNELDSLKPCVEEAGVAVLNQPFYAKGNVATAGGCLSSLCNLQA